jgi:molybdopterin/thiamine biosynthesis adenylyltransferase
MTSPNEQTRREMDLAIIGAGNTGAPLVELAAHIPGVGGIIVCDPGVYVEKDLRGQLITPRDLGRNKANVQGQRLRAMNPALRVRVLTEPVERLPLGELRADVILAAVDTKIARLAISLAAWRLNSVFVDTGVAGADLRVRVNVYRPGPDAACLMCAWGPRDLEQVEQRYPCQGAAPSAPATNAPAALGALAASLAALECEKLLSGRAERALIGRQVLVDALWQKHYVTTYTRNPQCPFPHEIWDIEELPGAPAMCLGDLLALGAAAPGSDATVTMRVAGSHFVSAMTCRACGRKKQLLRLEASLGAAALECRCGGEMVAAGFDRLEQLDLSTLPAQLLQRPLRRLGLRHRDVVTVSGAGEERHFELVADAAGAAEPGAGNCEAAQSMSRGGPEGKE